MRVISNNASALLAVAAVAAAVVVSVEAEDYMSEDVMSMSHMSMHMAKSAKMSSGEPTSKASKGMSMMYDDVNTMISKAVKMEMSMDFMDCMDLDGDGDMSMMSKCHKMGKTGKDGADGEHMSKSSKMEGGGSADMDAKAGKGEMSMDYGAMMAKSSKMDVTMMAKSSKMAPKADKSDDDHTAKADKDDDYPGDDTYTNDNDDKDAKAGKDDDYTGDDDDDSMATAGKAGKGMSEDMAKSDKMSGDMDTKAGKGTEEEAPADPDTNYHDDNYSPPGSHPTDAPATDDYDGTDTVYSDDHYDNTDHDEKAESKAGKMEHSGDIMAKSSKTMGDDMAAKAGKSDYTDDAVAEHMAKSSKSLNSRDDGHSSDMMDDVYETDVEGKARKLRRLGGPSVAASIQ